MLLGTLALTFVCGAAATGATGATDAGAGAGIGRAFCS